MSTSTRFALRPLIAVAIWGALVTSSPAQPVTTVEPLPAFGGGVINPLVQAPDGTLLGTTTLGGRLHLGTIFRIAADGVNVGVHQFSGPDGAVPLQGAPLLVADDGNIYGVTLQGNPSLLPGEGGGCGTVFQMTPAGEFRTIHFFSCLERPRGGLVQGRDGRFYGFAAVDLQTCVSGVAESCGVIYRLSAEGAYTVVHQFEPTGGWSPRGELVAVGDNLYGLTRRGGNGGCGGTGCGTVFRLASDGSVTTFAALPDTGAAASEPSTLVYHETDGALYGVMRSAGPCNASQPDVMGPSGCGAVFRLGLDGTLTTVFSFTGGPEGNWPSDLAVGRDDALYGVTQVGGTECDPGRRCGTVFRLTTDGTRTTVLELDGNELGVFPQTLSPGMDGDFFGTTLRCMPVEGPCNQIFRIVVRDEPTIPNVRMTGLKAPSRAEIDATITLGDRVINDGSATSPPSTTGYWLLPKSSVYATTMLGVRNVPELAPGAASDGTVTAALPAGLYLMFARADNDHRVVESLEYDNAARQQLVVGPDLVIRKLGPAAGPGIELQPAAPTDTIPTTINVYTANTGAGTAGTSITRLYRSNSGTLADAILIAEFDIGKPKTGEHDHRAVNVLLPRGEYYLIAVADAGQQVAEADESNLFKLRVTVSLDLRSYLVPNNGNVGSITTGPDGAVWFTLSRCDAVAPFQCHESIGRSDPNGVLTEFPLASQGLPRLGVYGITTGPDGALWYTEIEGNAIGRITTGGAVTRYPLAAPHLAPYRITTGPDGALWFTEAFGIGRITVEGVATRFALPGSTASSDAVDIVTGPDGALWFTEINRQKIGRITTQGAITEFPMPPGLGPRRITNGPDGALWFTGGTSTIGRLTTAGVLSTFRVGKRDIGILGITLGPDGALWFTEFHGQKVGRITTAGSITEFPDGLGSEPGDLGSGPGDLTTTPSGIWFVKSSAGGPDYIGHIRLPGDAP